MISSERRAELDAELAALNASVDAALKARETWMDAHMADYAKYQIGDALYDTRTSIKLGLVVEHYRYHRGNPLYDEAINIDYRYRCPRGVVDNTSRQPGLWVGNAEEARHGLESQARMIAIEEGGRDWAALFNSPSLKGPGE